MLFKWYTMKYPSDKWLDFSKVDGYSINKRFTINYYSIEKVHLLKFN